MLENRYSTWIDIALMFSGSICIGVGFNLDSGSVIGTGVFMISLALYHTK